MICATAEYKKVVDGLAAGAWFCHTQNSNHLDQIISLNQHKLSLLVNNKSTPCNVSQEKATCHDGAIGIKETI